MPDANAWVIIPAAGLGRRAGGSSPKQFWNIGGRPVLIRALEPWVRYGLVKGAVVVAPVGRRQEVEALLEDHTLPGIKVVEGGDARAISVRNGLDAVPCSCKVVAVHDAARPFADKDLIERVLDAGFRHGAALAAVPVSDTLKKIEAETGRVVATVPREGLWAAQTPQAFHRSLLEQAFREAGQCARQFTDECSLVEALGIRPVVVKGSAANLKVTRPEDRKIAEAVASTEALGFSLVSGLKVGTGFDAHRFDQGRPLVLGGVRIREKDGLLGHSDADVLAHAVTDALLGAVGLGDIGTLFPDTEQRFEGADSMELLALAAGQAGESGFGVLNVDAVIMAQEPRIGPFRKQMEGNIARALGIPARNVSVKATTTEGMGFVGRKEGIAASATLLAWARKGLEV